MTNRDVVKSKYWQPLAEELLGDSLKLDFAKFESLFKEKEKEKKKKKSKGSGSGNNSRSGGQKKSKKQPSTLFPDKRNYNVAIGLKMFKMPNKEIYKAIITTDESVLNLDSVNKLISVVPDPSEVEIINTQESFDDSWNICDRFFWEMRKIPNVKKRLELWLFKLQFEENISFHEDRVNLLHDAAAVIRGSDRLKEIFGMILAVGNYMNAGTKKGNVYAFKLSTLTQLTTPKSLEGDINLLHYIIDTMENHNPNAFDWLDEFGVVGKAAKQNVNDIESDLINFEKEINNMIENLEESIGEADVLDNFHIIMRKFSKQAKQDFDKMKDNFFTSKEDNKNLAKEFGEKKDEELEYLKTFAEFISSLKKSIEENRVRKKIEEKEAKKKRTCHSSSTIEKEASRAEKEAINTDGCKRRLNETYIITQRERKRKGTG